MGTIYRRNLTVCRREVTDGRRSLGGRSTADRLGTTAGAGRGRLEPMDANRTGTPRCAALAAELDEPLAGTAAFARS